MWHSASSHRLCAMRGYRLLLALPLAFCPVGTGAQMLETETAPSLGARHYQVDIGYELQTSSEGREVAMPFAIEYGLTDWLEALVEPVPYTAILPKSGRRARGAGDIEVTLTALLRAESHGIPAFGFAAEVKVPTAHDALIGTGRADYTGYFIASKRAGAFDVHANLSYSLLGSPPGVHLRNVTGFALATEFHATPNVSLYGEVLATTAAAPEGENGDVIGSGAPVPEAAGAESVGSLGLARYFGRTARISFGVSYDNNAALQIRPGVTIWIR